MTSSDRLAELERAEYLDLRGRTDPKTARKFLGEKLN